MALFKTTPVGLRKFFFMVSYIAIGVVLFGKENYQPSSLYLGFLIAVFSVIYVIWCYRIIFKYPIVLSTGGTIYNSYIKKKDLNKTLFALFNTVVLGALFTVMLVTSSIFISGFAANWLPGESLSIDARCQYSSRHKFFGVSNYLTDQQGREIHFKSNEYYCGLFSGNQAWCRIETKRTALGDSLLGIQCNN